MKVAWCTPLEIDDPASVASLLGATALAESCEVRVFSTSRGTQLATELPTATMQAAERFNGFDHVVFNYGNDPDLFGPIHQAALTRPGVIVLRSLMLHRLFAGLWLKADANPDRYVERMAAWYGYPGALAAAEVNLGTRFPVGDDPEASAKFPLWQEALAGAEAVVIHDPSLSAEIREEWDGPLIEIPDPARIDSRVFADEMLGAFRAARRWRPWLALSNRVGLELAGLGTVQPLPVMARAASEIENMRRQLQ